MPGIEIIKGEPVISDAATFTENMVITPADTIDTVAANIAVLSEGVRNIWTATGKNVDHTLTYVHGDATWHYNQHPFTPVNIMPYGKVKVTFAINAHAMLAMLGSASQHNVVMGTGSTKPDQVKTYLNDINFRMNKPTDTEE